MKNELTIYPTTHTLPQETVFWLRIDEGVWNDDLARQTIPSAIRQRLPELLERASAALRPCDTERLTMHLAVLGAFLPSRHDAHRAEIWIRETRAAICHWPDDLVERAMTKAKAQCRFLPTPAELTDFVSDALAGRNRAYYRIKQAMAWPVDPEPVDLVTPDEVAAIIEEAGLVLAVSNPARDYTALRQPTDADYAALRDDLA